jgi:hypothetical protein
MKRVFGAALLCIAAMVCVLPATAFGAQYSAYVGCSSSGSAAPSHVCQVGNEPGAFFESADAEVEYEVCVILPGGEELCSEEEEAEEGVLYVNVLPPDVQVPGDYLVNWYVEGLEVAAWTFRMEAPAPPATPPAPTVTPPAPVITVPAGPTPACQHASHRVKQLKVQLGTAGTAKAKKSLHKRLRIAKAAAKRAC